MKISLTNVGKRFNTDWVFRHLDHEFHSERSYAIVGPNGSGKSTLLQVIAGATSHSEGDITFVSGKNISPEHFYSFVSISAPYLELVEEMTLTEFLQFHSSLKKWLPSFTAERITGILEMDHAAHKQIRYFSSGMKQRVKLAQAIFSDTPVVLLDEPCTNLDTEGITLYRSLIKNYADKRLLIISSNDTQEYDFCDEIVDIRNYKAEYKL